MKQDSVKSSLEEKHNKLNRLTLKKIINKAINKQSFFKNLQKTVTLKRKDVIRPLSKDK